MPLFDYERAAREAGLSPEQLEQLCRLIRAEFPADEMMFELHVLRACLAIRDGMATVEEILQPALATTA